MGYPDRLLSSLLEIRLMHHCYDILAIGGSMMKKKKEDSSNNCFYRPYAFIDSGRFWA